MNFKKMSVCVFMIFGLVMVEPIFSQEGPSTNLCSVDSECTHACGYQDECYVKSCTPKCVEIGKFGEGKKGRCEGQLEYYINEFNDLEMIEIAKNFLISKVGKDFYDKHYEYDAEDLKRVIIEGAGEDYFNTHFTSNGVEVSDRSGRVFFFYKTNIPGRDEIFSDSFNFIMIGHCKGKDYHVTLSNAVFETMETNVSEDEAKEIARKEGFEDPLKIEIGLKNFEVGKRPAWILIKEKEVGCEEFKGIYIDMFEGKYIEKVYDNICSLESEIKIIGEDQEISIESNVTQGTMEEPRINEKDMNVTEPSISEEAVEIPPIKKENIFQKIWNWIKSLFF